MFFGISTISPNAVFVGRAGHLIGSLNYAYFGSFACVYPFVLIYSAWQVFKKHKKFSWELASQTCGVLLLFLSVLLALSMIKPSFGGLFGTLLADTIKASIGTIGAVFMAIACFLIAIGLCFEKKIEIVLKMSLSIKDKLNKKIQQSKKSSHYPTPIIDPITYPSKQNSQEPASQQSTSLSQNLDKNPAENLNEILNKNEILNEKADEISANASEILNEEDEKEKKDETDEKYAKKLTSTGVEILQEVAENKELLAQIEKGKVEIPKDFKLPSLDFLAQPPKRVTSVNEYEIDGKIVNLLEKLRKFKIEGDVVRTYSGPVVTTFEFKPAPNVPVRKILNLQDDLAMALKAQTIRIQAPIPGKDVVGIEIPNQHIETIYLREILQSDIYKNAKSELTIALGKDIVGAPFVTDLKKLPHLLIAGTTGSGKSVGINAMLLSLLYRNSPKTLRLIMIDPKMLEFSMYNDIPHLLTPVITQAKQAVGVLQNLVNEMERRYKLMAQTKTKNIESYNAKMKEQGEETMPFIVIIIDELADLMMTSGKDVEFSIGRLAQMARASGIHLIVATQRPSVDVVTGLIKANLPSRISYRVGQKIDSKVILDQMGAESLLGRGDMLFTPPGSPGLVRLHAPFASESEIENIVEFLKSQQGTNYDESFLMTQDSTGATSEVSLANKDELFDEAVRVVLEERKTSISYLQRRLNVGYNRAANIIEQLEKAGVLSAENAKKQREILI